MAKFLVDLMFAHISRQLMRMLHLSLTTQKTFQEVRVLIPVREIMEVQSPVWAILYYLRRDMHAIVIITRRC